MRSLVIDPGLAKSIGMYDGFMCTSDQLCMLLETIATEGPPLLWYAGAIDAMSPSCGVLASVSSRDIIRLG